MWTELISIEDYFSIWRIYETGRNAIKDILDLGIVNWSAFTYYSFVYVMRGNCVKGRMMIIIQPEKLNGI